MYKFLQCEVLYGLPMYTRGVYLHLYKCVLQLGDQDGESEDTARDSVHPSRYVTNALYFLCCKQRTLIFDFVSLVILEPLVGPPMV